MDLPLQHNPANPNPSIVPYSSIYTPPYPYIQHHPASNPNPNPLNHHELYGNVGHNPAAAVDSYASLSSSSYQLHPNHQDQAAVQPYSLNAHDAAYYHHQDPNSQNWALNEALVRQYGANPVEYGAGYTAPQNVTEPTVAAIPNNTLWANGAVRPREIGKWKRSLNKTKIIQSVYCEICKVECSSKVVYEHHVLGRRHKSNIEKLIKIAAVPGPTPIPDPTPVPAIAPSTSAVATNPVIGPPEKPVSKPKTKNKASVSLQDLETKKRRVLEGGAAAHAVRSCNICNVVCNSDTVFSHHLAGQKHAAMVQKYTGVTRM